MGRGIVEGDLVVFCPFSFSFISVLGPLEGNIPVCRAFDLILGFSSFVANVTFAPLVSSIHL